ncbi:MAG: hypothetical protein WBA17_03825 [Saprospiraceae bacterium]
MRHLSLLFLWLLTASLSAQTTPYEADPERNTSADHAQLLEFYTALSAKYPGRCELQLDTNLQTDSGLPLPVIVLDQNGRFKPDPGRWKMVLLVNNAIHAGEACGVDGSMLFARDLLEGKGGDWDEVTVVIIGAYNLGGLLNRSTDTRVNQDGPQEHGFRGNARNLDLNRDFIKADTRNARSFARLFQAWDPDLFIDNHTTNGSDHRYDFTLIPTEHSRLPEPLARYQTEALLPFLYAELAMRGVAATPYVYSYGSYGKPPTEDGIMAFPDLPRYSTGYAALNHTLGFMPETHALKPFHKRVEGVHQFMLAATEWLQLDEGELREARLEARAAYAAQTGIPLVYELDTTRYDTLKFKGYTSEMRPSKVTGQDRLYYNHERPLDTTIRHYNYYRPTLSAARPRAYILPQAYREVAERLRLNGVLMQPLERDTTLRVTTYRISKFGSYDQPYEGHFYHNQVELSSEIIECRYRRGDYLIPADAAQPALRYVIETLEPEAPDSYFRWNFFDGVLQQKESFSPYRFEEIAERLLMEKPELKAALEAARAADPELAESAYGQLDWIYRHSNYLEPDAYRYPVGIIR